MPIKIDHSTHSGSDDLEARARELAAKAQALAAGDRRTPTEHPHG